LPEILIAIFIKHRYLARILNDHSINLKQISKNEEEG